MPAQIFALVYMSKSTFRWSQRDLTELLHQSRRDNLADAITGLLLYVDGNFMQLLEGAQDKVEAMMARIKKDARHNGITVLENGLVPGRHFSDWSMAFLDFTSPQVRALPGYSTFLETPFGSDDVAGMSQQNLRLLHYFRAVMTASDAATLRLAEAVEFPAKADPVGEHEG